ncbi:hypothetical protein NW754_005968 [Fusarium falciforme]|nr:hypothetical protein NW754_005968 [Fusarium falciforme]KAJ4191747.1 hypothetical protein NW767_010895 [Fusarium falciforme]
MTFRNLNETWRDVVFRTYAQDHQDDVRFPVTYLIFATEWKRNIIIEVPKKVDVKAYRHSVLKFAINLRFQDPVYDDEYISVRPRVSKYKIGESKDQAQEGEAGQGDASVERGDS